MAERETVESEEKNEASGSDLFCLICFKPRKSLRKNACLDCSSWFLQHVDEYHVDRSKLTCPQQSAGRCGNPRCSPCRMVNFMNVTSFSFDCCIMRKCYFCYQLTVCELTNQVPQCSSCRKMFSRRSKKGGALSQVCTCATEQGQCPLCLVKKMVEVLGPRGTLGRFKPRVGHRRSVVQNLEMPKHECTISSESEADTKQQQQQHHQSSKLETVIITLNGIPKGCWEKAEKQLSSRCQVILRKILPLPAEVNPVSINTGEPNDAPNYSTDEEFDNSHSSSNHLDQSVDAHCNCKTTEPEPDHSPMIVDLRRSHQHLFSPGVQFISSSPKLRKSPQKGHIHTELFESDSDLKSCIRTLDNANCSAISETRDPELVHSRRSLPIASPKAFTYEHAPSQIRKVDVETQTETQAPHELREIMERMIVELRAVLSAGHYQEYEANIFRTSLESTRCALQVLHPSNPPGSPAPSVTSTIIDISSPARNSPFFMPNVTSPDPIRCVFPCSPKRSGSSAFSEEVSLRSDESESNSATDVTGSFSPFSTPHSESVVKNSKLVVRLKRLTESELGKYGVGVNRQSPNEKQPPCFKRLRIESDESSSEEPEIVEERVLIDDSHLSTTAKKPSTDNERPPLGEVENKGESPEKHTVVERAKRSKGQTNKSHSKLPTTKLDIEKKTDGEKRKSPDEEDARKKEKERKPKRKRDKEKVKSAGTDSQNPSDGSKAKENDGSGTSSASGNLAKFKIPRVLPVTSPRRSAKSTSLGTGSVPKSKLSNSKTKSISVTSTPGTVGLPPMLYECPPVPVKPPVAPAVEKSELSSTKLNFQHGVQPPVAELPSKSQETPNVQPAFFSSETRFNEKHPEASGPEETREIYEQSEEVTPSQQQDAGNDVPKPLLRVYVQRTGQRKFVTFSEQHVVHKLAEFAAPSALPPDEAPKTGESAEPSSVESKTSKSQPKRRWFTSERRDWMASKRGSFHGRRTFDSSSSVSSQDESSGSESSTEDGDRDIADNSSDKDDDNIVENGEPTQRIDCPTSSLKSPIDELRSTISPRRDGRNSSMKQMVFDDSLSNESVVSNTSNDSQTVATSEAVPVDVPSDHSRQLLHGTLHPDIPSSDKTGTKCENEDKNNPTCKNSTVETIDPNSSASNEIETNGSLHESDSSMLGTGIDGRTNQSDATKPVENHMSSEEEEEDILDIGLDDNELSEFAYEETVAPKPEPKRPVAASSVQMPSMQQNRAIPAPAQPVQSTTTFKFQKLCFYYIGCGACPYRTNQKCRYDHDLNPTTIFNNMRELCRHNLELACTLMSKILRKESPLYGELSKDWGKNMSRTLIWSLITYEDSDRRTGNEIAQKKEEYLNSALKFLTAPELGCSADECEKVILNISPPVSMIRASSVIKLYHRIDRERIQVSAEVWNRMLKILTSVDDRKKCIECLESAFRMHPSFHPNLDSLDFLFRDVLSKQGELVRLCQLFRRTNPGSLETLSTERKLQIIFALEFFGQQEMHKFYRQQVFAKLFNDNMVNSSAASDLASQSKFFQPIVPGINRLPNVAPVAIPPSISQISSNPPPPQCVSQSLFGPSAQTKPPEPRTSAKMSPFISMPSNAKSTPVAAQPLRPLPNNTRLLLDNQINSGEGSGNRSSVPDASRGSRAAITAAFDSSVLETAYSEGNFKAIAELLLRCSESDALFTVISNLVNLMKNRPVESASFSTTNIVVEILNICGPDKSQEPVVTSILLCLFFNILQALHEVGNYEESIKVCSSISAFTLPVSQYLASHYIPPHIILFAAECYYQAEEMLQALQYLTDFHKAVGDQSIEEEWILLEQTLSNEIYTWTQNKLKQYHDLNGQVMLGDSLEFEEIANKIHAYKEARKKP